MNAKKKLNKYQKEALFISGYFNSTNNHNMANEKDYEDIEFIARRLRKMSEAYAKQQSAEQQKLITELEGRIVFLEQIEKMYDEDH